MIETSNFENAFDTSKFSFQTFPLAIYSGLFATTFCFLELLGIWFIMPAQTVAMNSSASVKFNILKCSVSIGKTGTNSESEFCPDLANSFGIHCCFPSGAPTELQDFMPLRARAATRPSVLLQGALFVQSVGRTIETP